MVNVGKFVGAFIVILVGLILTPMVADYTWESWHHYNASLIGNATWHANPNVTATQRTILGLVPFMWVIAVIGIAVALGISAFRDTD